MLVTRSPIVLYKMNVAVADAGFIEGGSAVILRAKNLGPRPLLPKTTPIFERF